MLQLFYITITLVFVSKSNAFGYDSSEDDSDSDSVSPSFNQHFSANNYYDGELSDETDHLGDYFESVNEKLEKVEKEYLLALWDYQTNMTIENERKMEKAKLELRQYRINVRTELLNYSEDKIRNFAVRRQWQLLVNVGTDILDDYPRSKLQEYLSDMIKDFESIRVPHYMNKSKLLNSEEITVEMKKTPDTETLKYYWTSFYEHFDDHSKQVFRRISDLFIDASNAHGYSDPKYIHFSDYYKSNVDIVIKMFYSRIQRLYWELHAYVRYCLRLVHGRTLITQQGHIPAHLLGDLWGKSWEHLYESTKPYKNVKDFNVTDMLISKNYSVVMMAKMAEQFFKSLYLESLPQTFWRKSILEKPKDGRKFDCTPRSWDFFDGEDYRLTMCGEVNEDTLMKMYYEMGHLQYMMQYKDKPHVFKRPPTSAFYEAVALLPSLTVKSLSYQFKKQFFVETPSYEQLINYLYKLALDKIVFVPYACAVEVFRLEVLNRTVGTKEYNLNWWKHRYFGGIGPPDYRTEKNFDFAGILDGMQHVTYTHRLIGEFMAFFFHEELCKTTSHYEHCVPEQYEFANCDLFGEKEPGKILQRLLSEGAATSWTNALHIVTKARKVKPQGLMVFFHPLLNWLIKENRKNQQQAGWL
ncbi:angiotensin-converting enzyme-like isoform X2 [Lycorma delicatula]|uniref:angiotensin-converting enzyme-like isoform X2 n=1 Tax=Lycorma delicatula TaxID=130591 RepID=UPI003F516975